MVDIDPNATIVVETFGTEEVVVPDDYVEAVLYDGPVTGGASYYFNANLARIPLAMAEGAITYDANGAELAFAVRWPDGTLGQYTATTVSTAFPGTVDAYTVTYGSPTVIFTYTQPAVTRNTDGTIATKPAITVS